MIARLRPDVAAREVPELARPLAVEREADRGLVELVDGRPGVAQIAPRHRGHPPHEVVDGRAGGGAEGLVGPRHDLHVRGHDAVPRLQQQLAREGGAVLDQLQLEEAGRADDLLRPLHVLDAGQLHEDLVAGHAVGGDDGLGDAELVDAALDGLQGLPHRLLAKLALDARQHAEGVAAGAVAPPVVAHLQEVVGDAPELLVAVGGDALDPNLRRGGGAGREQLDADEARLLPQLLGVRLGLHPQRVVGLHPQHEVDAAPEIEAEPHLVLGRIDGESGRGRHREDGQQLPAQVLLHHDSIRLVVRPARRAAR